VIGPFIMVLMILLTGCTATSPTLAQRCEKAGMVWIEKRGEAGTVIGHECQRRP